MCGSVYTNAYSEHPQIPTAKSTSAVLCSAVVLLCGAVWCCVVLCDAVWCEVISWFGLLREKQTRIHQQK
jgi:hypothetical protein